MIWHYNKQTDTAFTYSTSLGMGFVITPLRFAEEQPQISYELWMKTGDCLHPVGQRFISYGTTIAVLKVIAEIIFCAQLEIEELLQ